MRNHSIGNWFSVPALGSPLPDYLDSPLRRMMGASHLYHDAARLLCVVSSRTTSLKNAFYNQDGPKNKAIYALVAKSLGLQSIIVNALIELGVLEGHYSHTACPTLSACTTCLLTVVSFDLCCPRRSFGRRCDALRILRKYIPSVGPGGDSILRVPLFLRAIESMDKVIEALGSSGDGSYSQVFYDRAKTSYKKYIKLVRNLKKHEFVRDYHFSNLILLLPPGTDLHLSPVITSDMAVIQDKASCVPSLILLDVLELPKSQPLKILDACAAPGNKTTLILSGLKQLSQKSCLMAFDRDKRRFHQLCDNLRRMHDGVLKVNGVIEDRKIGTKAFNGVICEAFLRDFLTIDPLNEAEFADVTAILVDPTCSASGLRCKRPELAAQGQEDEVERVKRLANLQAKILRHALSFPSVEVVVYSTCSIYQQENEAVVRELLESGAAADFELVPIWNKSKDNGTKGMGEKAVPNLFTPLAPWKSRGFVEDDNKDAAKMMARCLRSSAVNDLTIGFFVACFKRRK
ncbi:methyltransferase nsun5 [Echinococcus multilocularis]|uniref:Methyltransferase nsun5 n=1 Tax=Echinococcus multilocularis TaxID=6211 RepID=A0A068XWK2_ECHMU|nr:methyltransferase nsun5 [Echinococcus multilocularis]